MEHLKLWINTLLIVTRYPEDIDEMVKAFKKKKVAGFLKETKELIKWLKKDSRLKTA